MTPSEKRNSWPDKPEPIKIETETGNRRIFDLSFKTGATYGDLAAVHVTDKRTGGVVGASISDDDLLRLADWSAQAIAFKALRR